jgi:ADP-ribose pyrophosphatase
LDIDFCYPIGGGDVPRLPILMEGGNMKHEVLNRKTIYEGCIFDVQILETRLPDGKQTHYDIVTHAGAVALVPVDQEGNIWFVRQYRVAAGKELIELPAGILKTGEDPLEAAAREIREEIGQAPKNIEKLGEIFLSPGYSNELIHIYLATELSPEQLDQDDDEFIEIVAVPTAQAYEMARSGEILDGKTLAALLMAQPHIEGIRRS